MKITVSFRKCRSKAVTKLQMRRGLQLTRKVLRYQAELSQGGWHFVPWLAFSDTIKHSKDYSPKMDSQSKKTQKPWSG